MSSSGEIQPIEAAPEQRTIIEIGAGRIGPYEEVPDGTYWSSVATRRTFEPNERYYGIDLGARTKLNYDSERLTPEAALPYDQRMYANWARIKASRPREAINFVHADATKLPIESDGVDEVIASNFFGYGAPEQVLKAVYLQAQRVLKPSGKLIIHDDHTPRFVGIGSFQDWLFANRLPLPENRHVQRINYGIDPPTYVLNAQQYGLRYHRHKNLTTEFAQEGGYFDQDTIWILGKVSTD